MFSRTLSLVLLGSCLVYSGCSNTSMESTFSQDVGASFAPCNSAEIKFLMTRHNFMPAFNPCGNNKFETFTWSPDGRHLYFQLVMTGYVMDAEAENKATRPVPTAMPVGRATWIANHIVAIPVLSSDSDTPLLGPGTPIQGEKKLAIFDIEKRSVFLKSFKEHIQPNHLQRGRSPHEVLFVSKDAKDGPNLFAIDIHTGDISTAFSWLDKPIDTMTYTHEIDTLVVGEENTVEVYQGASGELLESWDNAKRGIAHPDNQWMILEQDGEAISVFNQRAWDELSERARAREIARSEEFASRLPEYFDRTVHPPTLSLVDRTNKSRWVIHSFLGNYAQWYTARDYYVSFFLWGFEGKQLKRNVLLGDLAGRMRSLDLDREVLGFEAMAPVTAPKSGNDAPGTPVVSGEADPSGDH